MSWFDTILEWVRRSQPLQVHPDLQEAWSREPESKDVKSWGLKGVEVVFHAGDRGVAVRQLQNKLEYLGYALPRFGADGVLGDETLTAVADFQDDCEKEGLLLKTKEHALRLQGVGEETLAEINRRHDKNQVKLPPIDETTKVNPPRLFLVPSDQPGRRTKRPRKWSDITGITLHQTATVLGERPERWRNVACHVGVPASGQIIIANGLNQVVYHGNALNSSTVGIEIDGHFEGVEGDISTYWRPKSKPDRRPLRPSEAQLEGAREAILWICEEVHKNGGEIRYIHAHRQSSKHRTSDPGSRIWKEVGMWAQEELGLDDRGPTFTAGGYPIPKEWNPAYSTRYRPWKK